ncbi:MAG: HAMP domain-containing histidine kinase [Prevotellaceae bacterium]|jgi:signal transduction histidine kinase|nr:HAMP domain-containing histidine kinase [Prevotellaceae bacterium]
MLNKRYIKISVSLCLCVIFAILSFSTTNNLEKGISDCNVGKIEMILHDLQTDSREIVRQIISNYHDSIIRNAPNLDNVLPKELQQKGVYLFIIDNEHHNAPSAVYSGTSVNEPSIHHREDVARQEILYWSENLPVTAEQLQEVKTEAKYLFLGNGWYIAQAYRHGSVSYITLILVHREYFYQNQFLRDDTNPVFNFPKNVIILPLGSDIGLPVKGISGKSLFIINSDISSIVTSNTSLLFRWITVIFIFISTVLIFYYPKLYRRNLRYLIAPFMLLLGLRIVIFTNHDFFSGDLYLFSPMLYADSEFLPSLGDLLLHIVFVFIFIVILFSAKDSLCERLSRYSPNGKMILFIVSCILISLTICGIQYITESLALNSEISFKVYKMSDITVYTFLAYFIIVLIFTQLCLLLHVYAALFGSIYGFGQFALHGGILLITLLFVMGFTYENFILFVLSVFISFLFFRNPLTRLSLSTFVWLTVTISLYVSFSLIINTIEREHHKRSLLAQSLLSERDPVAEMLLKDIEKKILIDPYIQNILNSDVFNRTDLYGILLDTYFKGYFQRYDLRYNVCRPNTKLHIVEENKEENCIDFFAKEKENRGIPLSGSSHFWFMNNYWGQIYYFGRFKFVGEDVPTFLFLELYSKPEVEAIGYPELLKFESKGIDLELDKYSYAKYSNGKLVTKFGTCDYGFELTQKDSEKEGFFDKDGYSHYMFSTSDGNAVILSLSQMGFFGVISIFSYTFVIFIVLLFTFLTLSGLKLELATSKNSYRWRISIVILAGIIGSLTTLTIAMLVYTISQSEKKNMDAIQSKMQSIIIELDQDLFEKRRITPDIVYELEHTLVRLSNAFYTDLNMYNIQGDLIVSSRNEIFEKNLIGTKMNRQAFYALAIDKQPKFIHTERIGEMTYYSSYTTYYNRNGEAIAYLNLPYFYKQSEFRNELLSLTGAIMNIYIFLIVIGIALSIFVSNQITRPLDVVRLKMAKLNFTEHPEPIDYKGNNELGDLVREYNRMIGELAESAKIMAENERESAWREMARQIAHEIKNPLTPMKLNIQLALRMKEQNREGWQEKMDEAINSTLKQIDSLSNIASEFSDFARTGKVALEPVCLSDSISSNIALFAGYRNINIVYNNPNKLKTCMVKANKEQLQRVFTNIIKNSIQATENVPNPEITITLQEKDNQCIITISDNGVGISEEASKYLFRPNFTTKSGGTGLGLAISKGIIESFGGTITFVPNKNGACFEINLPRIQG